MSDPIAGLLPLQPRVYDSLRALAKTQGVEVGPEMLSYFGGLPHFLGSVQVAGGTWRQVSDLVQWNAEATLFTTEHQAPYLAALPDATIGAVDSPRLITEGYGAFLVELDGVRVVAAGTELTPCNPRWRRSLVVLFGPTRETLTRLLGRVLVAERGPRLRIWGGTMGSGAPPLISESDLVLAGAIKHELLDWLDRFWRLGVHALRHGLPLRRGLLLVGAPGTGKTHFVRHLLTRYPDVAAHLFISDGRVDSRNPFGEMLAAVHNERGGSIVILEDIDHLADSGAVTKAYLLNSLDGLLEVSRPVLWVATSNDPSLLDRNLVDRPGRFDRVVVFPAPGPEERAALVRQFSTLPIGEAGIQAAAAVTAGFTGSHIREACVSATLAALDTGAGYVEHLQEEIGRMRNRHGELGALRRGGAETAGFHRATA